MKRWSLLLLALLTAFALVTGCATLDEKQRGWIFQPSDRSWWRGDEAAQGMSDVWISFNSQETGQPVKLHGLWLAHPKPHAPVLLYLHGARFNVVGSAFRARRMQVNISCLVINGYHFLVMRVRYGTKGYITKSTRNPFFATQCKGKDFFPRPTR